MKNNTFIVNKPIRYDYLKGFLEISMPTYSTEWLKMDKHDKEYRQEILDAKSIEFFKIMI